MLYLEIMIMQNHGSLFCPLFFLEGGRCMGIGGIKYRMVLYQ